MATEIKLPDMGDGIEDVTINRWLVGEGDTIEEGDPIVEVATDKVDTEVPASAGGTVLKLNFGAGELVPIDAAIAVVGEEGEEVSTATEPEAAPREVEEEPSTEVTGEDEGVAEPEKTRADEDVKATPVARRVAQEEGVPLDAVTGTGSNGQITKSDVLGYVQQQEDGRPEPAGLPDDLADVAPLAVRRAAADFDVDLRDVADDRPLSALNRYDILNYVSERDNLEHLPTSPGFPGPEEVERPPERAREAPSAETARPEPKAAPRVEAKEDDEFVPHSRMRTIVARNTSESAFTAPHVTTMWDVNMSSVLSHRKQNKGEFEKAGVRLTLTAYFVKALIAGVRAVPAANSSWRDDGLVLHNRIHVGMATALPQDEHGLGGLIVPVIKNADDLSLMGIARQVGELATKARENKLTAGELQGGTITLTNYGTSGSRFQTPIIVQPQVAILGVGAIEKRPLVVSQGHPLEANTGDYMTFAPMTTLGLSYDHRVLDGATADAFCAAVKDTLESWRDE